MSSGNGDERRAQCAVLLVLDAQGRLQVQALQDPTQFQRAPSAIEIQGLLAAADRLFSAGACVVEMARQSQPPRIIPMPGNPKLG